MAKNERVDVDTRDFQEELDQEGTIFQQSVQPENQSPILPYRNRDLFSRRPNEGIPVLQNPAAMNLQIPHQPINHQFQIRPPPVPPRDPTQLQDQGQTTQQSIDYNTMFQMMMQQNNTLMNLLLEQRQGNSVRQGNSEELPNFHVMPDLSRSIQTFNGENSKEGMRWLDSLITTARLHKWPTAFTYETARTHLTGAARSWFLGRKHEVNNWEEFETAFRRTFNIVDDKTSMWTKMINRVQGAKESLHLYYHDKVNMCRELNLNFNEAKERVVVGLYSRELASLMMPKVHWTEDDLYHDLIKFDKIIKERVDNHRDTRGKSNDYHSKKVDMSVKKETADGDKTATIKKRETKCYNCLQTDGHLANECPHPKKLVCFTCKLVGHKSSDCPNNKKSENDSKSKTSATTNEKKEETKTTKRILAIDSEHFHKWNNERFFKNVLFGNDIKLIGYVDSGSALCTIRASAVLNNDLKCVKEKVDIYAFGSTEPVLISERAVVSKVQIDEVRLDDIKFHVVPDSAQPVDVFIGRTFTEHPGISYSRSGDKLTFEYENNPFAEFANTEADTSNKVHITAAKTTVLEQKSINLVSTNLNNFKIAVANTDNKPITILKDQAVMSLFVEPCTNNENVKSSSSNEHTKVVPPITKEMITVDVGTEPKIIDDLTKLLNTSRDCFALNESELGCTDLIEMDIEDNSIPVRSKPYRVSRSERETIGEIVTQWKEQGLVQPTDSEYASPVLLVPKKTGESRLVVDFRKLNSQTVKKNYPMPTIDDQLERLTGCSLFTSLDLAMGYMQVPLSENARKKTAFITPDDTGEFTRMMFGLCGAPYVFCRLMNRVLGSLKNKIASCYLDDVLIPSVDWKEMFSRLEQVLDAFRKAKLTLRLSKCEFGKKQIEYLGFKISEGTVQPGTRKVEAIMKFKEPTNVTELKRFLGLSSFFRRFVENYAKIARPLTELTRRGVAFVITEKERSAFELLKGKLCKEPVLMLYNPDARTELHTDASAEGLAGMLMQEGKDGQLHLVYCVSKKTSDVEKRYHSTKLELMAIVWCIERLRTFLYGLSFLVVTDCLALVYLQAKKTTDSQIARWFNTLSDFDFEVRHREGSRMAHVDALSRAPVSEPVNADIYDRVSVFLVMEEEDQVLMIQRSDPKLSEIITVLKKPSRERSLAEKNQTKGYLLVRGKLMREVQDDGSLKQLFVIPKSMRKSIVVKFHDLAGHFALDRTLSAVRKKYWFPEMKKYIQNHIRGCFECLMIKVPGGKKPGELHPIPVPTRPFERIHIDHVGPLVKTPRGNNYILTVIDALTKFTRLFAVKSTKTGPVLRSLQRVFQDFGLVRRLVSDRGSSLTSKEFEQFCQERGIRHTLNSSRHPQANGQVERVHRVLIPTIIASMKTDNDWDNRLKEVEINLNNAENKTNKKTPFECLYGYVPTYHDGILRSAVIDENYRLPNDVQDEVKENVTEAQMKSKQRYDAKRYVGLNFEVGNIVVMRRAPILTHESQKLQHKFRGPLVITEKLPSDTYRVSEITEATPGRCYTTTAHVSQLKIYKNPIEDENDKESIDESIHNDLKDEEFPQADKTEIASKSQIPKIDDAKLETETEEKKMKKEVPVEERKRERKKKVDKDFIYYE